MSCISNTKSAVSTVRLFPRLGPASVATTQARIERPATRDRLTRASSAANPNERAQVRARLLRMILENERARRHGHQPNAS